MLARREPKDLTLLPILLVAIGDTTAGQVVRRELENHLVTRQDADVVHPDLAGDVSQHLMPVLELNLEHGIGQRLDYGAFKLDCVFALSHLTITFLDYTDTDGE